MFKHACALAFTVVVLLVGAHPRGAYADLSIDGPAKSQQILRDWYAGHIPDVYKATGNLAVHELNENGMVAYLTGTNGSSSSHDTGGLSPQDAASIDGVYDGNPSRIAIALDSDGTFDTMTFAHEYGHYVWFNLLSKADRKAFTQIYNQDRADGHLVTDYAGEDVQEGFAEAFSFYVSVGPILNHRDPSEYTFFANWKGK